MKQLFNCRFHANLKLLSIKPCETEKCKNCELSKYAEASKLNLMFDGYWLWIESIEKLNYSIAGKYLFFSENKDELVKIAFNEIQNHGFHKAKVSMRLLGNLTEYVLCLYFKDDSRKYELAERNRLEYGVKYRFWKSDEATSKGQYSKEFLDKLPKPLRKFFTMDKTQPIIIDLTKRKTQNATLKQKRKIKQK